MATYERNVVLESLDESGNHYIDYPITTLENIQDGAATKAALSDDDAIPVLDSEAGNAMKKVKVADLKQAVGGGGGSAAVYAQTTMLASKWNGNKYSFEDVYPFADFDIEVFPADTCTSAQYEAWGGALMAGSATSNICTAVGIVPTVDIPVIIKAMPKTTETAVETIMLATGWSSGQYSFESLYPFASYDIEVQPNMTCTEEHMAAWAAAMLAGSAVSNVCKAIGKVPAIDIPIIIRMVIKND